MTVIKIQLSGAPNKNQENLASIPMSAKHKEVMTLKLEANKRHNISKMIFKSCTHSNGVRAMVLSGLILDKFNPRQTPAHRPMSRSHPNSHVRFIAGINISTTHAAQGTMDISGPQLS